MERRINHRQPVRRPGRISLGGTDSIPCSISDLSSGGAKLEIPSARAVGNSFDLRDVMTGAVRKCTVAWRDHLTIGVRFVGRGTWPSAGDIQPSGTFGRRQAPRR